MGDTYSVDIKHLHIEIPKHDLPEAGNFVKKIAELRRKVGSREATLKEVDLLEDLLRESLVASLPCGVDVTVSATKPDGWDSSSMLFWYDSESKNLTLLGTDGDDYRLNDYGDFWLLDHDPERRHNPDLSSKDDVVGELVTLLAEHYGGSYVAIVSGPYGYDLTTVIDGAPLEGRIRFQAVDIDGTVVEEF